MAGLTVIAVHRAAEGSAAALVPVLLTVAAGLGWAVGNICSRQARAPKPLHLTLWMSVVPPLPLLGLSLLLEGPRRDWESLRTAFTARRAARRCSACSTSSSSPACVGYGLWNTLLARNPSSVVAPFAMLVPITGVLSAWLFFDEVPDLVELVAGVLVVGGVLYGSRTGGRGRRPETSRSWETRRSRRLRSDLYLRETARAFNGGVDQGTVSAVVAGPVACRPRGARPGRGRPGRRVGPVRRAARPPDHAARPHHAGLARGHRRRARA